MAENFKSKAAETIEGDPMDGATDIVFLLIIFFLVASSFSSEKKENVSLTERTQQQEESIDPDTGEVVAPQGEGGVLKSDMRIVVKDTGEVEAGGQVLELDEPNSIELYYKVSELITLLRERLTANPTDITVINPETGLAEPYVQIWADKQAPSGIVMHSLQACLDKGLKPDILFLSEMEPEEANPLIKTSEELAEEAAALPPYEFDEE